MQTAAKQCYHCQGYGHVQADCPTLRISGAGTGGRCYTCGQPGHLAVSFLCMTFSSDFLTKLEAILHQYSKWWPDRSRSRLCRVSSRRIRRWSWLPRWLCWWPTPCDLLQMRRTQPLRAGLSGSCHEMLRLRQAGKYCHVIVKAWY